MGEKVYRPVVKDGDHLVRSKDNPSRVRGLSRDENNKNPDIPEWEEFDLDDLTSESSSYSYSQTRLSPEMEALAATLGEALGNALVEVSSELFHRVIAPWWSERAWPWLKQKGRNVKSKISRKHVAEEIESIEAGEMESSQEFRLEEIKAQIDRAFEQCYFELDEEEAREHMMRLIYHMLGVANEIRIISNARIRKDCTSETLRIEKEIEAETLLSERVAIGLDHLLSNPNLHFDLETSRVIFALTGGGVRLNGEYVPVQAMRITDYLQAFPQSKENN